MLDTNDLADKIFSLLKGNNLQLKIYNDSGDEIIDPAEARRIFIVDPSAMVTINDDTHTVEFSKADPDNRLTKVQSSVKALANEFQMNFDVKVFGKSIHPKDFAFKAKIKRNMAESVDDAALRDFERRIVQVLIRRKRLSVVDLLNAVSPYVHEHDYIVDVLNKMKERGVVVSDGTSPTDKSPIVTMSESTENSSCPKCGSSDIKTFSDQEKQCHTCSHSWDLAHGNESITESFSKMFGSLKTSRQTLENVRILVKHRSPVDDSIRGSRSRKISSIFLECNGERFRFPHNYLPGARAMAQHMAHGGAFTDKVGGYIIESTTNLLKLQSFNRYVSTNGLINEDSSDIVETVKENIQSIKEDLRKLTGKKTYETAKARIETFNTESLEEDDTSTLRDMFTVRKFDEKFEEVLPIVKQLIQERDTYNKRIEEAASSIVRIRKDPISPTPILEFGSDNARLGYKVSELSLRIVENDELAGFVGKVGTKIAKEGTVNSFEKAILSQVLENLKIQDSSQPQLTDLKESIDIDNFFDRYSTKFF